MITSHTCASPYLRIAESHVAAACAVLLRSIQGLNMNACTNWSIRSAVRRTWAFGAVKTSELLVTRGGIRTRIDR